MIMLHLFVNGSMLIKELGLDQNTTSTNKTYIKVNKTNNHVISDHTTFFKSKFNLKVKKENRKVSNIYWTPKLHKHSSKARYIIAAPQCSVKSLSEAVTSVLKLMYKRLENYDSKSY